MVYVIQVLLTACERDQDVLRMFHPDPACKLSEKPVWQIPLLCVQWKTPDDGHRNCPKHVEFYSKNKFEKLVHLVGFIIRFYHDARAPEGQNVWNVWERATTHWGMQRAARRYKNNILNNVWKFFCQNNIGAGDVWTWWRSERNKGATNVMMTWTVHGHRQGTWWMRPGRHTQNTLVVVGWGGGHELHKWWDSCRNNLFALSASSAISLGRIAQLAPHLFPVSLIKNNRQLQGHGDLMSGAPPLWLTIVRLNWYHVIA